MSFSKMLELKNDWVIDHKDTHETRPTSRNLP